MARKKPQPKKNTLRAAVRKVASKSAAKKPAPAPKKSATAAKSKSAKVPRKKAPSHALVLSAPRRRVVPAALGRPKVPADAKLEFVFQRDLEAREIFAFLGIHTIRQLERLHPDDIIQRVTSPVVQTVGRIRKAMALCNRALADDLDFAIEFQERVAATRAK